MKSILIPSIIDLLSKYNRLAALTMIIVGVESTLTMFGMRERAFLCCLDNWECSLCLCVVFWFCFLLIMDIRNPLEEMVLKIFLLDIISIRSLSTSHVSSTDRMFFFSLYDQAPFCFHVTLFFCCEAMPFSFFIVVSLGTRGFSTRFFLVRATSFIQVWSWMVFRSWCDNARFDDLFFESVVVTVNINTYISNNETSQITCYVTRNEKWRKKDIWKE